MQEDKRAAGGEGLTATPAFWLNEAERLKETAELCWSAEQRALGQGGAGLTPSQSRLQVSGGALGGELELLYRYLIALAIQYLAIGLLIDRDPHRFLHRPPGHRILALLEECAVPPSPEQRRLLGEAENAFAWGERYPVTPRGSGAGSLLDLVDSLSATTATTAGEKAALDELYGTLLAAAQGRRASTPHG